MSILTPLPPPPYQAKLADSEGYMTPEWQKWFLQLSSRIGGINAISNISINPNVLSKLLAQLNAGNTDTVIYTSPAGVDTVIDLFQVKNNDPILAHTISVNLVPVGASPDSSNLSTNALSIAAGGTVTISSLQNQILGSGAFISCKADVAGLMSVSVSGRAFS